MPDYGSCGVWCSNPNCGVMLLPSEDLGLPENICYLLEGWSWFWDEINSNNPQRVNETYFNNVFQGMGLQIVHIVSEYYDCKLVNPFSETWLWDKNRGEYDLDY